MQHLRFTKFFLFVLILQGCKVTPEVVSSTKVTKLSHVLQYLGNSKLQESQLLARDIFYKTANLTHKFALTSPPLWHNFLVNFGLKEKGLCYHWADALYLYLKQKNYKSFEFHLVGTHVGEYFSEHNALVVTTKEGEIQNGVLLDPWRNSGKLYFSQVKEDKKYIWVHRLDRGCE